MHSSAPLFTLYLTQRHDLFWGFYPVIEHEVIIDGEHLPIYDPMGKDTELFHHTATIDPESSGSLHLSEAARRLPCVSG